LRYWDVRGAVPDGPADVKRLDGTDHAIIQTSRLCRVSGILQRMFRPDGLGRDGLASLQGLTGSLYPAFRIRQGFGDGIFIILVRLLDNIHKILQRGNLLKTNRRGPGFDSGSTPGGIHQTYRNIELLMKFSPEKVGGGGETTPPPCRNCFRGTNLPGSFAIGLRLTRRNIRNHEQTDIRIVGGSRFLGAIHDHPDAHFHIRLPGTNPYFAHQNIGKLNGILPSNGHLERPARLLRRQLHHPFSIHIGCRSGLRSIKGNFYLLARIGPAPNRQRHRLLQNHMITDHMRQSDIRQNRQGTR